MVQGTNVGSDVTTQLALFSYSPSLLCCFTLFYISYNYLHL
jgi:hypothetical protein